MRCFSYTPRAGFSEVFLFYIVQTKTQEQGLIGYSSVLLTSRASHRLGKCRSSWVWHGLGCYRLLASAVHAQGAAATDTPRLASSRYRLTRQLSPDMTSSYICLFILIVLLSEEFLLHSSGHAVLVRSFSYTPRDGFIEEFLLHSSGHAVLVRSFSYTLRAGFSEEFLFHPSSWFYWGVSVTLLELVLVMSFSYTPHASFSEAFLLNSWW